MKRILTLILALALVFALAAPALAEGENPTSKSTNVTYEVGTKYFISIPAAVTIANGTATQTVSVTANSIIPANQKLQFIITGATNYGGDPAGFRMINNVGTDVYLSYTIKNGETPVLLGTAAVADPAATNPFLEATAAECYAGKTVTLTYTTGTVQSAGEYSDALTFTVGLANIA